MAQNLNFVCLPDDEPNTPPTLDLLYSNLDLDGTLIFYGRVNHDNGQVNYSDLVPDFLEQASLLNAPTIHNLNHGFFKLQLSPKDYQYESPFWDKFELPQNQYRDPLLDFEVYLSDSGFTASSDTPQLRTSNNLIDTPSTKLAERPAKAQRPQASDYPACEIIKEVYVQSTGIMDTLAMHARSLKRDQTPLLNPIQVKHMAQQLNDLSWHAQDNAKSCERSFFLHPETGEYPFIPSEFHVQFVPPAAYLAGTVALYAARMAPAILRATKIATRFYLAQLHAEAKKEDIEAAQELNTSRDKFLDSYSAFEQEIGTGELWDNLLGEGSREDLEDWEAYDHAHHIIQQQAFQLDKARKTLQQCFKQPEPGSNFRPDKWNQSGMHSRSNGVPVQPWFHADMHPQIAAERMRDYILEIENSNNNDKLGECDFEEGDTCSKIQQFLEKILKPYIKKKNKLHKEKLEEELQVPPKKQSAKKYSSYT